MIHLHDAIYALNSSIVFIKGDTAYDAQENVVEYNKSAAEAKLAELQATATTKQTAETNAKASALAKLAALGLTQDEVKALIG